jgi:hypothetical protein
MWTSRENNRSHEINGAARLQPKLRLTAEPWNTGASKRRQRIAPPVRPGYLRPTGMSAEGAARVICAGPSDLDFFSLSQPLPHGRGYSLPALRASLLCEPVIENPCLAANDPSVGSTKDTIWPSCVSWSGQIRCPLTTELISNSLAFPFGGAGHGLKPAPTYRLNRRVFQLS